MYLRRGDSRRRRDDRGAVAVVIAILAIVMFAMAAISVDLGNALARKRSVQAQADFAALAGGANLGVETSGTVPATVVDAVRDYLNANQPLDSANAGCSITRNCVTSAQLTNTVLSDAEVRFANGGLQVVTPTARVDFGFAAALDFSSTLVQGNATVGLFSPGIGVLPVYAVAGCDYGGQTITDPAGGQVVDPVVPPLAYDSHTNATSLDEVTPNGADYNAAGATISLTGRNFQNTTKIGFFRADDTDPSAVVEQTQFTVSAGQVTADGYTRNNGTLTLAVPTTVTSVETAWYIRVYNDGTQDKWSARSEALPFRVGEAVLECTSGSNSGNFGTLRLPRTDDSPSNDIPLNIAKGLQEPMTLRLHAQHDASGLCVDGVNGAVVSGDPNPGLREGTNCVDTDPGLPAGVATQGLIQGVGSVPGLLRTASTRTGCDPTGGSTDASVTIPPKTYTFNNDVLTCYLKDGSTSLAEIADPHYAGGEALLPELYESPRFFFQPVLGTEPGTGSSNYYSIVDFRPAFITDEVVAASTIKGTRTASSQNGLYFENGAVKRMRVVYFNLDALPRDDTGGIVTPYLGVGPRFVRLIN